MKRYGNRGKQIDISAVALLLSERREFPPYGVSPQRNPRVMSVSSGAAQPR